MAKSSLLILCAGFGKRMFDLTSNIPKPLLKFNNKILLGNTIDFFQDIGFNEIFINTHYLHKKIETYIDKNYNDSSLNLIYEPSILRTGGGVKNIFNYTKNNKICVVNSDIFWLIDNKIHIVEFLKDFNDVTHCKLLLSKKNNFYGLKNSKGDFNIRNGIISNWIEGNEIIFYSGFQVVSKHIFKNTKNIFSINDVWNSLIASKKLKGSIINSKILHIGDKNSYHNL